MKCHNQLIRFVQEEKGDTRCTWQQCLECSIVMMNGLGIEAYFFWITLAQWSKWYGHEKVSTLVCHQVSIAE